jgi:pyruvate dehydrogenase E1 component beta subunit
MPWTKILLDPEDVDDLRQSGDYRALTYVEALREAQAQLLENDPRVFLIGQGIDDSTGVFGSTQGLAERFGAKRVMDSPIAENGVTGMVLGAAAAGMRPIYIHHRIDFLPMAMDQIVNHAAKWSYMSGGNACAPLVIRSLIGRGWGSAAQHSQSLYGLFMHVPGLRIVVPASPYDAKGLMFAAVEDPNPVLFVEHRWLYNAKGYVPEQPYTVAFGEAVTRVEGQDVTIVAISQMVHEALKAAKELRTQGISVEVIDPRTISPLDDAAIIDSVAKTGRIVIADTACAIGGASAEIACRIAETIPEKLKAPIKRITFPNCPTPAGPSLEQAYYPGVPDIVRAVREVLDAGSG